MDDVRRLGARTRSAVFAPIGDVGRAAGVERRLAEAIRSGILTDGERLPSESDLATRLGVATVTAREALVGLRSRGLVTTVRGRGGGSFVVGPRHDDDAELRRWLGSMTRVELVDRGTLYSANLAGCAELAAERAVPDDVRELRAVLATVDDDPGGRAPVDVGAWRHVDIELHLTLAALTASARLSRAMMRLEADFGVLLRLPFGSDAHRTRVRRHQVAVVDAVETGDAEAARARIRRRVREALEDLAELGAAVS